jgi:hypothetical protein
MLYEIVIGVDNGTSGSIGVINCVTGKTYFIKTPSFSSQNYTKKKGNISRIKHDELYNFLAQFKEYKCHVLLERPLVNPARFSATISGVRALESTLIVIEQLKYSYEYTDSKLFQRMLLPIGSTKEQLKIDSMTIGKRLFPEHETLITKHKDADGILIAEYGRRIYNKN